jgi:hypothetical protein
LSNAADAAFPLTSDVPDGTETANAATGGRTVCDAVGRCATQQPIGGNKVDKKAPAVAIAQAPSANANGWNNTDVVVTFTVADSGSGVASSPADLVFSDEGANQSATRQFSDQVGNTTTVSVDGIDIDRTPPVLTVPAPFTTAASTAAGAPITFSVSAADDLSGSLDPACIPASGGLFAMGQTTVDCQVSDRAGNAASASFVVTVADQTPPAVVGASVTVEATGPDGALVAFGATATDTVDGTLPAACTRAPGSMFGLGATLVTCTATDAAGNTGQSTLTVSVVDTTPPVISGQDLTVTAPGPLGAPVLLGVTAADTVAGAVAVACTPANGSVFPLGATAVDCTATDGFNNSSSRVFTVTVVQLTEACFTVDFREITYFRNSRVLTSSDAGIRQRNGIAGPFDPSVWPYSARGRGQTTRSRGTLFRLYGFAPEQAGQVIRNADDPAVTYEVRADADIPGAFYADLEGPARVTACPSQLHDYVLAGDKHNGHKASSHKLPSGQRNVPGVMLTRNSQVLKIPTRVRRELRDLNLPSGDKGLVDYVGVQLQGGGDPRFREFVDVEVAFPWDSATDREAHYQFGFHTAANTNFESFAGCNYVDHTPGNDSVRLRDLWGPNRSSRKEQNHWQACGRREPRGNQTVRADYDVPFNAIQLLPTVNSGTDTLRLFFGPIRPVPERERTRHDRRDWRDWDAEDDRHERDRRNGRNGRRDRD